MPESARNRNLRTIRLPLEDLAHLAQKIHETWEAQHPYPDDDGHGTGDEDGSEDRYLRLGATLDGVGKVNGDLTAGCTAEPAAPKATSSEATARPPPTRANRPHRLLDHPEEGGQPRCANTAATIGNPVGA